MTQCGICRTRISKFNTRWHNWYGHLLEMEEACMQNDLLNTRTIEWRYNEGDNVSNHRCLDCLLNRLFRRKSTKTSRLRVTGICVGNPPVTGEFPSQLGSNAENISIWWRHHEVGQYGSVQKITHPSQANQIPRIYCLDTQLQRHQRFLRRFPCLRKPSNRQLLHKVGP